MRHLDASAAADRDERLSIWWDRVTRAVDADATRGESLAPAGRFMVRHTYQRGSTHQSLTRALAGSTPARSRITIHSLEDPSTDVLLPAPVSMDELGGRTFVPALADSRWRITWDPFAGVVRAFDRLTMTGIFVTQGPPEDWENAAPFRAFLHWGAASEGAALIHASTVGTSSGMALVVGTGGTGKSTTTLIGLASGLDTCGDDYVWVECDPKGVRVRSVYGTLKVTSGTSSELLPRVANQHLGERAKSLYWLGEGEPHRLVTEAPLVAMGTLAPPGTAVKRAALLAAAGPSTVLQMPYDEHNTLRVLRNVVHRLPVFVWPRDGDLAGLAKHLDRDIRAAAVVPPST